MRHDDDPLDYQQLMHTALRDVVRRALVIVAHSGLPPGHHFYITFLTQVPGVELPPSLLERYPEEMTIVVQHQFWNLEVHDDAFEISLSFQSLQRHLVVPFKAVIAFVDPPAEFGLRFAPPPGFEQSAEEDEAVLRKEKAPAEEKAEPAEEIGKVVSLADFRKK